MRLLSQPVLERGNKPFWQIVRMVHGNKKVWNLKRIGDCVCLGLFVGHLTWHYSRSYLRIFWISGRGYMTSERNTTRLLGEQIGGKNVNLHCGALAYPPVLRLETEQRIWGLWMKEPPEAKYFFLSDSQRSSIFCTHFQISCQVSNHDTSKNISLMEIPQPSLIIPDSDNALVEVCILWMLSSYD